MSSVSLSSHLRVSSSWVSYAPSSWPAHAALTCAGSWAYQLFTSLHFLFVFLASSFPCCSHSPLLSRHPCFPNVYSWISLVILFPCKAPFQMFLYVKMRLTLIHFESLNLARPLSSPTRFSPPSRWLHAEGAASEWWQLQLFLLRCGRRCIQGACVGGGCEAVASCLPVTSPSLSLPFAKHMHPYRCTNAHVRAHTPDSYTCVCVYLWLPQRKSLITAETTTNRGFCVIGPQNMVFKL